MEIFNDKLKTMNLMILNNQVVVKDRIDEINSKVNAIKSKTEIVKKRKYNRKTTAKISNGGKVTEVNDIVI